MLETASVHTESLSPSRLNVYANPNLSLPELISLVEAATAKGKKRAAPTNEGPAGKRVKTHADQSSYPRFTDDKNKGDVVYRHVADIEYTVNEDDQNPATANFLQVLDGLRPGDVETVKAIDLGDVEFRTIQARPRIHLYANNKQLLVLPIVTEHAVDLDAFDYTSDSEYLQDLLLTSQLLATAGKVEIRAQLQLVLDTPFRLRVISEVSLVMHALFDNTNLPVRKGGRNKKQQTEMEDAQRRFFTAVYPPESAEEYGDTTIHSFYSILGPAPPAASEELMQPEELLPTLLPFQRRSVAWLLGRENRAIDNEGTLVDITAHDNDDTASLPLFYDRIKANDNVFYINRLSGCAFPSLPSLDAESRVQLGGILAEEPGLGKTLETIALVLLNPAPAERRPENKHWDTVGGLDVHEVKTTLIVTPVSLIQQWADEIKAHAPTLKVFVYEGWNKLTVPITEENAEEACKKRDRAKAKSKAKTKSKKATKGKGKGKSKATTTEDKDNTPEDEPMDVDEDEDQDVEDPPIVSWPVHAHTYDIILVTYAVLRHDFAVARPVRARPRREDVVYSNVERPRSPLVMCEWRRVVMDEVQLSGGGMTEEMVSMIPRISSIAVSGTPAKTQVTDLLHVLKFLRIDTLVGNKTLWNRLIKSGFGQAFASLFRRYAIRTTKPEVKNELTIPEQTRYLVGITLGRVERHIYDQTFETALYELGLDARGIAASEGWEVDGTILRATLRRLRGICTHPQVGQMLKSTKDKLGMKNQNMNTLKTMTDVLQNMCDTNWRNLMEDWKLKVQLMIRLAQLKQKDDTQHHRYRIALEALDEAEPEAKLLIQEIRDAIKIHDAKGEILKQEAAARKKKDRSSVESDKPNPNDKGKGKAKMADSDTEDEEDGSEDEEEGGPKTAAEKAHTHQGVALHNRLRDCRVVLHRIKFMQGDAYNALGPLHASKEEGAYGVAEEIRRDLLKLTEDTAKKAMTHLENTEDEVSEDDMFIAVPFLGDGGIRSADMMEEADRIIDEVLNEQSAFLWEWRAKIRGLLTQSLTASDEADGLEYQRTLDSQGEVETYIQVYAALLADRRQAITSERTLLASHDAREKKLRHTKAAIKAAAALDTLQDVELLADFELQPEHEVLHKQLSQQRKELLDTLGGRAIKSVLADLNGVVNRIHSDKDVERVLVLGAIKKLRGFLKEQAMLMDALDTDLANFRKAFNDRILYFRQLQEISDSVAEVTWETTLQEAIEATETEKQTLDAKILTVRARQRFLTNLAKANEEGEMDEDDKACILCRCDFTRGFLTSCAHVFCEGCLKAWLLRKEGGKNKTCPVCRSPIDPETMQRFTVDEPVGAPLPAKPISNEPAPLSRRQIQYNMIPQDRLEELQKMETDGDYSKKIETLVKHLLYIQSTEPGSKSIVFSAWADSLYIIEHALATNGIKSLRIDNNAKGKTAAQKFRIEPDYLVLLLHGERENTGLNVTCASRVFLLESVVHHGFELQAIARIDRMGQKNKTEVYCYYAEETVERNILDLAARKGLSLYTSDNSAGTLNTSSFDDEDTDKVVDAPVKKVQKGDFIYKLDDMLAILFPHMFEDIEFLIPSPEEGDTAMDVDGSRSFNANIPEAASGSYQHVNAVAGPSRLG